MKYFKFLVIGILFGIVLTKSEVISWYRIQEMFRFQTFHMYGIIGSACVFGFIITTVIKKQRWNTIQGKPIQFFKYDQGVKRYLFGGILFGLGWALTGACPGPMYVLLGNGFTVFVVVILSAMLGTFCYGLLKNKLPH